MALARWAAVAVTGLMGLANLGLVTQDNVGLKIVGPVLALAAVIAIIEFARTKTWGFTAIVGVGAVNLVAAIIGAFAGMDGWPIGLVLSALALVLASVSRPSTARSVPA
jgi:hypothetical protein